MDYWNLHFSLNWRLNMNYIWQKINLSKYMEISLNSFWHEMEKYGQAFDIFPTVFSEQSPLIPCLNTLIKMPSAQTYKSYVSNALYLTQKLPWFQIAPFLYFINNHHLHWYSLELQGLVFQQQKVSLDAQWRVATLKSIIKRVGNICFHWQYSFSVISTLVYPLEWHRNICKIWCSGPCLSI